MNTTHTTPKPALLILAAGMGSRYGGLKQIDPVGPSGEVVMDYSVYDALRAGFGRVVFVIRRDIEKEFRAILGRRFENRVDVSYAFQELADVPAGFAAPNGREKPWGTGHAIFCARQALQEPFAAINADDFYGKNSFDILGRHLSHASDPASSDYVMVGFILRQTLSEFGGVARGICRCDSSGCLESVTEVLNIREDKDAAVYHATPDGERHPLKGDEIVSMNMWGFRPSIFGELNAKFAAFLKTHGGELKSEFYIPSVVNELIRENRASVHVLSTPDPWFGVTYKDDKPRVMDSLRKLIERGDYPARLWP